MFEWSIYGIHKINDCLENNSNTQALSFSLSHSHAVPVGHFMLCIMCFHVQSIFLRVLKQTLLMIHLTLDGDHASSILPSTVNLLSLPVDGKRFVETFFTRGQKIKWNAAFKKIILPSLAESWSTSKVQGVVWKDFRLNLWLEWQLRWWLILN